MINEFRNKTNEELGQLVVKMKSKLLEYRFREASGELEGTHKVKMVKKTIAMALTVLSERNVKLSLSSHDHALILVKDGKKVTNSFKPKNSSSIIFEEEKVEVEEKPRKKIRIGKRKAKREQTEALPTDKATVEKKITKKSSKQKNISGLPSSVIRKSTGRGQ